LVRWNILGAALNDSKANLLNMSTNTPLVDPSYMAGYPSYSTTANLPKSMYYITNSVSDDNNIGGIWANSLYNPEPSATPSGTKKVVWESAAINTTSLVRFATGFTPGKSELLPIPQPARDANFNFSQNPGY
jgi:hypothetical protein